MGEATEEDVLDVVRLAVAEDEHPVSPTAEPPPPPPPPAPPNPEQAQIRISATPFVWRDPAKIPSRAWLYGKHYIRKFLTCTVGLGGGGKTSALIVEALAMAGVRPTQRPEHDIDIGWRVASWRAGVPVVPSAVQRRGVA